MRYLSGIHEREGSHIVPPGGWVLDVVSIAARQSATDYTARGAGLNWIVRLNWGYGSTGTIPLPAGYSDFAQECAAYVAGSKGCTRWIIGNESNHSQEWPAGQVITPAQYAACFQKCRAAIKRVQPDAEVIPAPVAPWNVEAGDWIAYQRNVWDRVEADALAVHSYIHEADPNLVNSDQTMDPPFEDRLFQFNAYRDLLFAVPDKFQHLPVYMTEANPLSGWQARGIIPAMLDNVNWWNEQPNVQQIQCVCFYRYPDYDKWGMESKGDVITEFKRHATRHWSPEPRRAVVPTPPPVVPVKPAPDTTLPPRQIDDDFRRRVPELALSDGEPGKPHYRLIRAEYVPDGAQRFGPDHHILIEVLDAQGNREMRAPVNVWWGSGAALLTTNKPVGPYAVDYQMYNAGHSFGVRVANEGATSDSAFGMGLGKLGNEHMGDHVTYYLVFQRVRQGETVLIPDVSSGNAGLIKYVTAVAGLNVRSAPRMDAKVIDTLPHGTPVRVEAAFGVWRKIGLDAWVHGEWLSDTQPTQPAPPVVVEPGPVEPVESPPSGIIDPLAGQAILQIESGGQAFGPGGRLLIRFENHLFLDNTGDRFSHLFRHGSPRWTGHMWRISASASWRNTHVNGTLQQRQDAEWSAFEFASTLNRNAALQSISMGAPQILGSHFRRLGYPTPEAMFRAFGDRQSGQAAQMIGFTNFVLSNSELFQAIKNKDFHTVARIYNGPGQAEHYATLMRNEYRRLGGTI